MGLRPGSSTRTLSQGGRTGYLGIRFDTTFLGSGPDYWYEGNLIETPMRARNVGFVVSLMLQCKTATSINAACGSDHVKSEWLIPILRNEPFTRLPSKCEQLFGGYGCMEEYLVARATGGISGFAIGAPTSEIMSEIIARRGIGR